MSRVELPCEVKKLFEARSQLADRFNSDLIRELPFPFDGKLVGDIGKWIATDRFGVQFEDSTNDGILDGTTLQVRATVSGKQASFRYRTPDKRPAKLLVFEINEVGTAANVVFHGSFAKATSSLYQKWDCEHVKITTPQSLSIAELYRISEEK
ncbi:MAG: hypothetical protein AAFP79_00265 [Pseudomonadota bacterium]